MDSSIKELERLPQHYEDAMHVSSASVVHQQILFGNLIVRCAKQDLNLAR